MISKSMFICLFVFCPPPGEEKGVEERERETDFVDELMGGRIVSCRRADTLCSFHAAAQNKSNYLKTPRV
jgi:hypothetical protein